MQFNESIVLIGDALSVLSKLPSDLVDTCVTSPPYWGLRNYGVDGQLGLEPTFGEYIKSMSEVFREVKRVLKPDGTLWLNMGDTYLQQHGKGFNGNKKLPKANRQIFGRNSNMQQSIREKLTNTILKRPVKPKNLLGMPWRLAFALQDDGWILRSDIIWRKTNAMPESCKDRPSKSHEYIFLLSKNKRYYYDIDATRTPHAAGSEARSRKGRGKDHKYTNGQSSARAQSFHTDVSKICHPKGKNLRTVWSIPSQAFPGMHFATYPPELIKPCIKAGSRPHGIVLDPFFGAGTTGLVAKALNRRYIGIELNPEYAKLAIERIRRGGDIGRSHSNVKSPQLHFPYGTTAY